MTSPTVTSGPDRPRTSSFRSALPSEAAGLADDGAHHVGAGRDLEVDAIGADARGARAGGGGRQRHGVGSARDDPAVAHVADEKDDVRRFRRGAGDGQVRFERQQHARASRVVRSQHVGRVVDAERLLRERRGQRRVDRPAPVHRRRSTSPRRNRSARWRARPAASRAPRRAGTRPRAAMAAALGVKPTM